MNFAVSPRQLRQEYRGILLTAGLVALITVVVFSFNWYIGLTRGTVAYVIPVLYAAINWGLGAALFASACGVIASAYFFFPPFYSLRITDPQELINLTLYLTVAVAVSRLASRLRHELAVSRQREIDMRALYAFSRRIAVAFDVADIQTAIEEHLTTLTQRQVILFAAARDASGHSRRTTAPSAPRQVLAEIERLEKAEDVTTRNDVGRLLNAGNGETWMVRAVSPSNREFGFVAVNLGITSQNNSDTDETRVRVDAVLADATATLDRLGIAQAITEARMRAETDQLRDAMIGSVSHELRTPLASIMGAATVLSTAPALSGEPKLQALVQDVRSEAERLNNDIQNLIDATRISSDGIKPRVEWADPADILDSALERCQKRLSAHNVVLNLPKDLPLVQVDAVLVKQALVQVFDNARKYAPRGSTISLTARARDGRMILSVSDEGAGLSEAEMPLIWDRFVRGERTAASTSGSGLGLWIAKAFVAANGGKMNAISDGPGKGTTMTIELPVAQTAVQPMESDQDE